MKTALYIAAAVVLLAVGAFVVAGLVIPNERTVTQVTEIEASPETVWTVLNDRENYAEWQDQIERVEIVNDKEWKEFTPGGEIEFRIDKRDEPRSMDISYNIGDSFKGSWRGELSPRGGKTLIRTVDKTMVDSWFTKVMMSVFFDIEDFAKNWNRKLKERCEAVEKAGDGRQESEV